jgi:peptide/nickel transport system substrate-binding protein
MHCKIHFRRIISLIVLLGVASLSLAGCAKTSTPTPVTSKLKIIRCTNSWPLQMDPAVGSDYVASTVFCNVYESLVFPNADGSVAPLLALSWVISPDGLTYTFTLRQGVKFHNGDELTAADVVFSLNRIMAIGEGYGYLFTSSVKGAKAIDKYTVEFTLKQPFGPFLAALVRLYVLDEKQVMANKKDGTYGANGDYGKDWLITHDAGSGPYEVKEMKTEESMLAEKFTGYWGDFSADAPDQFEEIGTTEPVTVKTLISRRELEISDQWQTSEAYASLAKILGVTVSSMFSGSMCNMMLNTKKAPTDDIHFRRALAYCVDYDTVVNQLFPGSKQAKGPVAASTPGSDPTLVPFKQDMVKAAEELKQSKYANSLDAHPMEIAWVAEVPDEEKIALMVQANAAQLGIKVNVVKVPWLSTVANMAKPQTTSNGTIVFVSPHYAEAGSMLESRYSSKSTGTWEQGEWLQSPTIDAAIAKAIATIDQTQRFAQYKAIEKQIVDLCPTIFLFDQAEKEAYQSDYVTWPAADDALAGKVVNQVMGYCYYFKDFKVFPEKIPAPAS